MAETRGTHGARVTVDDTFFHVSQQRTSAHAADPSGLRTQDSALGLPPTFPPATRNCPHATLTASCPRSRRLYCCDEAGDPAAVRVPRCRASAEADVPRHVSFRESG